MILSCEYLGSHEISRTFEFNGGNGSTTDTAFLYQRNGHRAEDEANVYYYTADGQLREVWRKAGSAIAGLACTYLYDGHGRRMARFSDDDRDGSLETALIFTFAGQRLIEEYALGAITFTPEATGNAASSRDTFTPITAGNPLLPPLGAQPAAPMWPIRDYVFGETELDDRIVYRRDVDGLPGLDEAFVYLANAYLSVFGLADATGAIVEAYDYTAFGRPFVISAGADGIFFTADDDRVPLGTASGNGNGVGSLFGNPYLFQSRRWEPALGLYDYRARFFDPFTEVWLTRDAAGFVNGSNLYQFVGSMPWILDPMGLCGRERSWSEHFRDGAAGFLDGALSACPKSLIRT